MRLRDCWSKESTFATLGVSILSCLHVFTFAHSAIAAPVSPERAVDGVSAWVARGPSPSRLPTGEVRTFSRDGIDYFHLVGLAGGGWVAMPADDAFSPVIAFDQSGELPDTDDGSPWWMSFALGCGMEDDGIVVDARDFRFDVEATVLKPVVTRTKNLLASASASPAPVADLSWGSLDGDTAGAKAWRERSSRPLLKAAGNSDSGSLIDVRVASFLATRWNQSAVKGNPCYNYYTPSVKQNQNGDMANAVCGCVATAMAQTMWYYRFPTEPVNSSKVYSITTRNYGEDKVGTTATMKGGVFDWDSMTADPQNAGNLTEVNREAIGKLTYNCGLAVNMNYGPDGSNNGRGIEDHVFESEFGYGGSEYVYCSTFEKFANSLFANFDARQPCPCNVPGHEVVGDGYGFSEGAIFVHLNMGWGGSGDVFYRQLGGYSSIGNKVGNIVCNISTNGVVRYVTGRVTDVSGAPLPGARVRAEVTRNGATTVQNLVTDENGIYAVRVEGKSNGVIGSTVVLSASMEGLTPLLSSRTAYTTSAADGNSWGNDFILLPEDLDLCIWTGGAGDCRFSTSGNWKDGVKPSDFQYPIIVFDGCAETAVTNDLDALSPDWIVFNNLGGVVTLRGNKIVMPDGGKISSYQANDATMPVIDLAVEYEQSIAVDGGVSFKRGVTGVDVASVSRYIGNFVLTTTDEWQGSGVIEAGSSVTVGKFYSSAPALTIAEGGVITTAVARVAANANLVMRNDGLFVVTDTLTAGSESSGGVTRWTGDEGSKGSFVFNRLRLLGKDGSGAYMFLNARDTRSVALADVKSYVVGPGGIQANNSYLSTVPGWPSTPIRCYADYSIGVNEGGASNPTIGSSYDSGECLYLDTTDWQDESVGHTITVNGQLQKNMKVGVLGCGTLHFTGSSTNSNFSNGLEVKDTATLAVDDGVVPGAGDVTMNAGTTLALPDYSGNPIHIAGKFSTSGSGNVHVRLGDGTLNKNVAYPVLTAEGGLGSVNLALDGLPEGQWARLTTNDNTVFVTVVDLEPGMYIGPNNGDLSDSANWSYGTVPTSGNAIFNLGTPATLTKGATFSPGSITFAEDSASVTINGDDLKNIVAITNLSSVSHTINAKVYFKGDIQVKQAAMAGIDDLSKAHVTFAGGAYAAAGRSLESGEFTPIYSRCVFGKYYLASTSSSRWTARSGGNKRVCVADDSYLYVPYAGIVNVLYVANGAKAEIGDMNAVDRLSYKINGEMAIANLTMNGSADSYVTYDQGTSTPGVFKLGTVTNKLHNSNGALFWFADANAAGSHVFYIGEGGLNYNTSLSSQASIYVLGHDSDGNRETIRPWYSDFTVGARPGNSAGLRFFRDVEFCTDDENGTGRTITLEAKTQARGTTPSITVSGSGTLKVTQQAANDTQPTVTVTDTATLALGHNGSLGTGAITVNSGAALGVAESSAVALGGSLTLADGAALAFNFTKRDTAPVLDTTGKAVTANGTVKITASADALIDKPDGGTFVVTSGGAFKNKTVVIADSAPYWAQRVYVNEDGNIVLDVQHSGAIIRLK